jgi:hypothetical protein
MLQFEQYITEMAASKMPDPPARVGGKPKVMSGKEAIEHFGRPTMNAVMRHPSYKKHIYPAEQQGFAHSVRQVLPGQPKYDVHIIHAVTGGKGIRHRIDFHIGLSGRKVVDVEHFTNKDNEKYPEGHPAFGQVKWKITN